MKESVQNTGMPGQRDTFIRRNMAKYNLSIRNFHIILSLVTWYLMEVAQLSRI